MRINVYSQELTKEVEMVSKEASTGVVYWGVRMYLASPDILHHTPEDDDRSAITFWIPNAVSFTPMDLADVFESAAMSVRTMIDPQPNG
jgi:hypothetical protein